MSGSRSAKLSGKNNTKQTHLALFAIVMETGPMSALSHGHGSVLLLLLLLLLLLRRQPLSSPRAPGNVRHRFHGQVCSKSGGGISASFELLEEEGHFIGGPVWMKPRMCEQEPGW